MRARLTSVAVAAASGLLWALCFGRETYPWLGWVALVPFVVLLASERCSMKWAVLLGVVHGTLYWSISIHWIPATIHTFGQVPKALAALLLVLAALYLSIFRVLFAISACRILKAARTPKGTAWALFGLPAFWVVSEWLYSNAMGSLSFPWNLAAYAWTDVPGALPLSAWIGPWGLSYLVVVVNVALALAWRGRRMLPAAVSVLSAFLLLVIAARWSRPEPRAETGVFGGVPVRVVQPNRELGTTDRSQVLRQYEQLLQQSRSECVIGEPTLLVWPESAAWPHTWEGSARLRYDLNGLTSRGCSVVFNTPTRDAAQPDSYFNSALLIGPGGPELHAKALGQYDKRFLVPWGETVPLGDVLPFVDRLARFAGRFSRGTGAGLLDWHTQRLGLAICYEVMFPGAMADQARAGATVLVNISNDAWYGDTSAVYQLFRAARFRAAENRRMLLRAGLTGISGVIDATGTVRQRIALGERGVLRERLRGSDEELTPYARRPWLVPLISAALSVLAMLSIAFPKVLSAPVSSRVDEARG